METTTTTTTATSTTEYEKGALPPPPPTQASGCMWSAWDAFLRVLLLAASVVAVVVMATSKETEMIPDPRLPPFPGLRLATAKFNYSPAFIYFVVALSVAGLYSIITGLASLSVVWKPSIPAKWLLILLVQDVLILGIVASATGTAGGVAYLGLKGNTHVQWMKVCHIYTKFCRYVGSSVAVALFAAILLVLLIISNAFSLYRRVEPKC